MTEKIQAGIVLKVRFQQSGTKEYDKYIDYMNRDADERDKHFQDFSMYNDYMGNPKKSSNLFSMENDSLSEANKKVIKGQFRKAQKNGSLMWQTVISFDTRWLIQKGLFDPVSGMTDEKRLKNVTRAAMTQKLYQENMADSGLWTAAIHYDKMHHIHVHVGLVEPEPTRTRGKLKPSTLKGIKSKIYNTVLDKEELHKEINSLIRDRMVAGKKLHSSTDDRKLRRLFFSLYGQLPDDKRLWNYKWISPGCPDLDALSKLYIEKYHKKDFEQLQDRLKKEELELKTAFGSGKKEQDLYKNFAGNRIQDLYKRMGNTILKELKAYDRQINRHPQGYSGRAVLSRASLRKPFVDYTTVNTLKKFLKRDFESAKNQNVYKRLQNEIEFERGGSK